MFFWLQRLHSSVFFTISDKSFEERGTSPVTGLQEDPVFSAPTAVSLFKSVTGRLYTVQVPSAVPRLQSFMVI